MRSGAVLLTALAVAAAGFAPAAGAQSAFAPGGWVELNRSQSVHFTITTDFKDDAYVRRLQGDLEKYFSMLQKEFWDFIPPRYREAHITVMGFATQAAFDAFAERDAGVPRGEKGYSSTTAERITFVRQDVYYRDVMILVHEMTHLFNRFCANRTPIWLDEGMAQFYANYAGEREGNAAVSSGVNPDALLILDAALKSGTFVPLSELLRMRDDGFYGGRANVNYAQSWALVLFLRRGFSDGDERFTKYYADIAAGVDSYAAFSRAYGSSHDHFSRMWLAYLDRLYKERLAGAAGSPSMPAGREAGAPRTRQLPPPGERAPATQDRTVPE